MTGNVKQFIEHNIDLIEQHEWTTLFDKWYTTYHQFDLTADAIELRELFDILHEIGIISYEHESARETLITKYFNEYIDDAIFENEHTVSAVGAMNSLHSWLGISMIKLKEQFVNLCKTRDLAPVDHDITKGRFILP